jgi:hypothetical protein
MDQAVISILTVASYLVVVLLARRMGMAQARGGKRREKQRV